MSNADEAMSPAEFAKLMGAYPQPAENPLPTYGGYMDNSPANFAWVNNNDYFGAEAEFGVDGTCGWEGCEGQRYCFHDNGVGNCQNCGERRGLQELFVDDETGNGTCDYCLVAKRHEGGKYKTVLGTCVVCRSEDGERGCDFCDLAYCDSGCFEEHIEDGEADGRNCDMEHIKGKEGWGAESKKGWNITRYGDDRYAEKDGVQVIIEPISKGSYHYHPRDAKWKLTYGRETPHGVAPLAKLFGTYEAVFVWLNNPPFDVKSFGAESKGKKNVECDFCSEKKPLGQMRRMPYDPDQDKRVRYSGYLSTYAICDGCYRDRMKGKPVGKSVLHAESQQKDLDWAYEQWRDGDLDDEQILDLMGMLDDADTKEADRRLTNMIRWIQDENAEGMGYLREVIASWGADTDLTPTNHMNNSIGQVVPITNPMELPTNLIETEAGGGPEGQITPDTFEAGTYLDVEGDTMDMLALNGHWWSGDGITDADLKAAGLTTKDDLKGTLDYMAMKEQMWGDSAKDVATVILRKGWGAEECEHCDSEGNVRYGPKDDHIEPCAVCYPEETFEAPYGGAGALMDIGKETPLADFTGKELAESSAIHGDFDQASLNYSGHQNLEVRAEEEEELYDCVSCGEWGCVSLTLGHCLDCGQQYDAEFEDLTGNITEVKNIMDESVARITISDTKYEDDENIVTDDVDILVTDMDGNTLIDQTLDDSWQPPYDEYDRHLEAESKMGNTVKTVGMLGGALALGGWLATRLAPYAQEVFNSDTATATQDMLENDPELVENPNTGDLDPAQYEELVVESTGYAVDVIPMGLDGSFMGSRFAALPTERYVEYNEPGIGAHTDIALNRDEVYLEPEMAMVQAAEDNVVKEAQAPGQSPYMSIDGQEPKDFDFRVIKETQVVSLDPAVKPFIPQSMSGYTGNANTPPSVYNKMFNVGVLGQTPLFVAGQGDMGSSHTGSRNALPDSLGIAGSVGGPLSDKVNANYTDGATSMSLAQWAIENTVSQTSDTEAVVIDRSSGAMKRVRRV